MPLERHLQKQVLARLHHIPRLTARKRWGTAFGMAGDPDLYCLWRGVHIEIELKIPGGQPTPLQQARLEEWAAAGAVCAVIHSLDELNELLNWVESGREGPGPQTLWRRRPELPNCRTAIKGM